MYGQRALIGVAPSTCIRTEKDSWGLSVKLLIGVALFEVTVTKVLQPLLDVLSWNTKHLSVGKKNSALSSIQNNELLLQEPPGSSPHRWHALDGLLPLFCGSEGSDAVLCTN